MVSILQKKIHPIRVRIWEIEVYFALAIVETRVEEALNGVVMLKLHSVMSSPSGFRCVYSQFLAVRLM